MGLHPSAPYSQALWTAFSLCIPSSALQCGFISVIIIYQSKVHYNMHADQINILLLNDVHSTHTLLYNEPFLKSTRLSLLANECKAMRGGAALSCQLSKHAIVRLSSTVCSLSYGEVGYVHWKLLCCLHLESDVAISVNCERLLLAAAWLNDIPDLVCAWSGIHVQM